MEESADSPELAKEYRQTLSALCAHFKSKPIELFCHISSLSPSSPDYDPEEASHLPDKTALESAGTPDQQSELQGKDADASACCYGPSSTAVGPSGQAESPREIGRLEKGTSDDSHSSYSNNEDDADGVDCRVRPLRAGRPDVIAHIRRATNVYGTVAIAVCGPKELVFEARNAVAEEQLKIVGGTTACTDLYLHTEVFEW